MISVPAGAGRRGEWKLIHAGYGIRVVSMPDGRLGAGLSLRVRYLETRRIRSTYGRQAVTTSRAHRMETFQFGSGPGEPLGIILVGLIIIATAFVPSTWRLDGEAAQDDLWKRLSIVALGIVVIVWGFMPSSRFSRLTAARTVVVLEYESPKRDVTLRPADIVSVRWKLTTSEGSRRWPRRRVESSTLVIKTVHGRTYRSASVPAEAARAMEYDIDRWVAAPARAAQPVFELPLRLPHPPSDFADPPR